MNTLSLIIILALIGIMMFLSFQNMLFAISRDVKEKIIESRIKNFVDIIETVSKISSDYFYIEYFIDQSDLKIENNTLKIKVDDKTYSFLLHSKVENVEINKASRYCIFKDRNIIKIFNCRDAMPINDGICEVRECRLNSEDCKGPNMACVNDGICNTYIGENCKNSPKDCESADSDKICCPENPSADEKGFLVRSKKKLGEECYCDSECEDGLKCNRVEKNFKEYKSNRACCPKNNVWNGEECIEIKTPIKCPEDLNSLPSKFDWRDVDGINYLNPVRNQGNCGSCWAFVTVGVIEAVYNIEANCPKCNFDLSEQFLLSYGTPCCSICGNCNGGSVHNSLVYIMYNGICDESCYPYIGKTERCGLCENYQKRLWKINNFGYLNLENLDLTSKIKKVKQAIICKGPILGFSLNWRHGVLIVGYDDDSSICKQKYNRNGCWIVRNSWGTITGDAYTEGEWIYHENGYAFIPYEDHKFSDIISNPIYVEGVTPPV